MHRPLQGVYDAQVVDIHPETYEVSVALRNLAFFEGIKVALGGPRQHPVAGDFLMPEVGDWGVVAFTSDNPNSGIWLTSRLDRHRHMIPSELLAQDPKAVLSHHPGDQFSVQHGDGSTELVWPDGPPGEQTMLRVTTRKDGSKGNVTARSARTERHYTTTAQFGDVGERKPFEHREQPPVDIALEHASGFRFYLSADGKLQLQTPKGIKLTIGDATEKARSAEWPHEVTSTPDEDGQRLEAGLALTTEGGHVIEVLDDPVRAQDARIKLAHKDGHELTLKHGASESVVALKTKRGARLELKDAPTSSALLRTVGGHELRLDDTARSVKLSHQTGRSIEMTDAGTTVTDPLKVSVQAPVLEAQVTSATVQGANISLQAATVSVGTGVVTISGGGPMAVRTGDMAMTLFGPAVCIGTARAMMG